MYAQRTYSDYQFFGRLHAARKPAAVKEATGLGGKEGAEAFVRRLNPEAFDAWMHKEITALERCFAALPDDRLVWMPLPAKKRRGWDCEVVCFTCNSCIRFYIGFDVTMMFRQSELISWGVMP